MSTLCISCQQSELRPATVKLAGVVRSEPYWVEMNGLKCPNCGYSIVDARGMTEFSRLLSDKYRAEHNLLTSDEIVALRKGFDENQQEFADRVGVGVASIKRWELGKIQDERFDKLIREKTETPVTAITQYACTPTESNIGSGTSCLLFVSGTMVAESRAGWTTNYNVTSNELNPQIYGCCQQSSVTATRYDVAPIPSANTQRHHIPVLAGVS
ncbi:MAG: type II TA system antitoxin MqsA family protein [Candidatus Korobacteraceae bacterium]